MFSELTWGLLWVVICLVLSGSLYLLVGSLSIAFVRQILLLEDFS